MATTKVKPITIIENNNTAIVRELQQTFSSPDYSIIQIGKGAAGIVYRVSDTHVIKVMPAQKYASHLEWYEKTFKVFKKMYKKYPRMLPYQNFYVHSTFSMSSIKDKTTKEPLFIYEKMEYLPMNLS